MLNKEEINKDMQATFSLTKEELSQNIDEYLVTAKEQSPFNLLK